MPPHAAVPDPGSRDRSSDPAGRRGERGGSGRDSGRGEPSREWSPQPWNRQADEPDPVPLGGHDPWRVPGDRATGPADRGGSVESARAAESMAAVATEAPADPADRPDAAVAMPPVRRLLSLAIAAFAALLATGLILGAHTDEGPYAVVIFGVQLLFVVCWTVASDPPAARVIMGTGVAVAVASDLAAVLMPHPASLAPLAYVTAAGFVIGAIGQLTRPAGRVRVTESFGSSLIVTLGVVAFGTLIVLKRQPLGTQAIVACMLAAGAAVAVARLADTVLPVPRIAPQVPRGGVGVVAGAMAGTAAAGVAGYYLVFLETTPTALAGLVTAIVAVMIDLSVGYADASRPSDGDAPALWLARHLQGPLGAFALAAPAAYAASVLFIDAF